MKTRDFFYCQTSFSSRLNRYAAMYLYPPVGFFLLLCVIYMVVGIASIADRSGGQIALFIYGITLSGLASYLMFKLGAKTYRLERRQIAFDQHGFIVRDHEDRQYKWNQISGIGIVIFAATASRQRYRTQICIFLKPVTDKSLRKLRNSYVYGAIHLDQFVLMEYTPFLADRLAHCCGLSIDDYRSLQLHRLL